MYFHAIVFYFTLIQEAVALNSKDYASMLCRSKVYFAKFQQMIEKDSDANLISHVLQLALQDADACISLQPHAEGGYLSKVLILRHISEATQARDLCTEGLRRVPSSAELLRVTKELEGEGDYDEAAELKKMLEEAGLWGQSSHAHSHDHDHDHSHPAGCGCPEHAYATAASETGRAGGLDKGIERECVCMHCGQPPAPTQKLLLCSACKSVSYCGE